jgi:hypothetical protein
VEVAEETCRNIHQHLYRHLSQAEVRAAEQLGTFPLLFFNSRRPDAPRVDLTTLYVQTEERFRGLLAVEQGCTRQLDDSASGRGESGGSVDSGSDSESGVPVVPPSEPEETDLRNLNGTAGFPGQLDPALYRQGQPLFAEVRRPAACPAQDAMLCDCVSVMTSWVRFAREDGRYPLYLNSLRAL